MGNRMSLGDSFLQVIGLCVIAVAFAYGAGRVHQWYEHSMDRDRPFRDGYNDGYAALFSLAARGLAERDGRVAEQIRD